MCCIYVHEDGGQRSSLVTSPAISASTLFLLKDHMFVDMCTRSADGPEATSLRGQELELQEIVRLLM